MENDDILAAYVEARRAKPVVEEVDGPTITLTDGKLPLALFDDEELEIIFELRQDPPPLHTVIGATVRSQTTFACLTSTPFITHACAS